MLRTYRLRAGLSQEMLAERAGISSKAIGAIEQGVRRAPHRHTVELLLDALLLTPSEREGLARTADAARGRTEGRRRSESHFALKGLPQPITAFIERPEVAVIANLLNDHRLVTVTGSPGVGKTRTAAAAAERYERKPLDVAFADLSLLRDPNAVAQEIADALGISTRDAVDKLDALVDAISSNSLLLIIDNCEHLIAEAARVITRILRSCHRTSILATSREPFGMSSEVVCRLSPLELPDSNSAHAESALRFPSVELFVNRAKNADANFSLITKDLPSIVSVCCQMDGIPLAIELAAARLATMGIDTLCARSLELFSLPGAKDLPERQRSMAAAILWSFDLLCAAEKQLIQRVCTFPDTFSIADIESIYVGHGDTPDAVAQLFVGLVDKSLIMPIGNDDGNRYMLLKSVRAFASEQSRAAANGSAVEGYEEPMASAKLAEIRGA